MKAEIIAVGSELLTPDRMDTNSLFLTQRLNQLGIAVARKTVVGDEHDHVRDAFRSALDRVELVVASGGLGPTVDDLTREAVGRTARPQAGPESAASCKASRRASGGWAAPWPKSINGKPWFPKAPACWKIRAARRPACGSKPTGASSCFCPARPTN